MNDVYMVVTLIFGIFEYDMIGQMDRHEYSNPMYSLISCRVSDNRRALTPGGGIDACIEVDEAQGGNEPGDELLPKRNASLRCKTIDF